MPILATKLVELILRSLSGGCKFVHTLSSAWCRKAMSNISLIHRLVQLCDAYEQGEITPRDLSANIELHAGALEGLPFPDYKALRDIADSFRIVAAFVEEGCDYATESRRLIDELRATMTRISAI